MLIDFFLKLRQAKVPVTTKEYLMLIEGMQKGVEGVEKKMTEQKEETKK